MEKCAGCCGQKLSQKACLDYRKLDVDVYPATFIERANRKLCTAPVSVYFQNITHTINVTKHFSLSKYFKRMTKMQIFAISH